MHTAHLVVRCVCSWEWWYLSELLLGDDDCALSPQEAEEGGVAYSEVQKGPAEPQSQSCKVADPTMSRAHCKSAKLGCMLAYEHKVEETVTMEIKHLNGRYQILFWRSFQFLPS